MTVSWRALRRDERGATALEFALVAPMLIAILIATIEIGLLAVMSANLDASVIESARKIRTGADDRPQSTEEFKAMVCSQMVDGPTACASRLVTSVRKANNFAGAQAASDEMLASEFDAGAAGDIILVRATYRWPLILPMYAGNFKLAGPTEALLSARATFKNEPYE